MNKNLQSIKSIPIVDYLQSLGVTPIKRYGGYALYNAPYREDRNASMKVDFIRNLWYDFGLGKGGSIIDLVMLLSGCNTREAISHLTGEDNLSFHSPKTFIPQQDKQASSRRARRILSIGNEMPPHLLHYLQEERKIDLTLAKPYLRAIRYQIGDRQYTAIAFPNRTGGYELRDDKSFKGTVAPKDITIISSRDCDTSATYNLFEGFIDFLSYLTMKGKEFSSSIVLNSVSNLHRAISYLQAHRISSVRAFLDNDDAGRKALQSIQSAGIKVEDMSRYYQNHKDLNDFHVARQREQEKTQSIKPAIHKRGVRR